MKTAKQTLQTILDQEKVWLTEKEFAVAEEAMKRFAHQIAYETLADLADNFNISGDIGSSIRSQILNKPIIIR